MPPVPPAGKIVQFVLAAAKPAQIVTAVQHSPARGEPDMMDERLNLDARPVHGCAAAS
jgi:hypothetical protein